MQHGRKTGWLAWNIFIIHSYILICLNWWYNFGFDEQKAISFRPISQPEYGVVRERKHFFVCASIDEICDVWMYLWYACMHGSEHFFAFSSVAVGRETMSCHFLCNFRFAYILSYSSLLAYISESLLCSSNMWLMYILTMSYKQTEDPSVFFSFFLFPFKTIFWVQG